MLRQRVPRHFLGVLVGLLSLPLALSAQERDTSEGFEAITRPSERLPLSFARIGQIDEILVEAGDRVKAGQPVVRLDDKVERIRLEHLKAQAENDIRIQASEAELEQKIVELNRVKDLQDRGVATKWELERAKVEKLMAELSVELSRFNKEQAVRKYEEAKAALDRMTLKSSLDGIVSEIQASEGQTVKEQQAFMLIHKLDPLWIEVPVPEHLAETLEVGGKARVHFPRKATATGTIIYKATEKDSASETQNIRVEVPNPSQRAAGDIVRVEFLRGTGGESTP